MRERALLFDIYQTLLDVAPPPADAATRWPALCRSVAAEPAPDLAAFQAAARAATARAHAQARAAGIPWPEVDWPAIARAAWPALAGLAAADLAAFLVRHAALVHTTAMGAAAAAVLRRATEAGWLLGLASNAQAYTRVELAAALRGHGLDPALFAPDLCFLSYEHGFAKPDPHVFRLLAARLGRRGLAPAAALMVGDRADNDIEPARAIGFQTWLLRADGSGDGGWPELERVLFGRPP